MFNDNNTVLVFNMVMINFFQGGNKSKPQLKPIILESILDSHKEQVIALVKEESEKPVQHTQLYDKYSFLINRQVCYFSCAVCKICCILLLSREGSYATKPNVHLSNYPSRHLTTTPLF